MKKSIFSLTMLALFFSCQPDNESVPISDFFEEPVIEDFSAEMSDFEIETLALINTFRADENNCGGDIRVPVEPLMWHPNLDAAAEAHAIDMEEMDVLSHNGSNGSSLQDRLVIAEYMASYSGENVAKGPPTPESAVEAFKDSPAHCRVMSSPNFKQVGIAKKGKYWVFDFGTPMR